MNISEACALCPQYATAVLLCNFNSSQKKVSFKDLLNQIFENRCIYKID